MIKKIAISGLNNTDNPAPGIPVAKSLKDEYSLIGLSYDPNEPGNYQGLVDSVYLMPYPSMGIDELKKRLEYIKDKDGLDAIIPNLDAELPLYIKYQKEIESMGIKLFLPTLKNFELRDKNHLAKLSKELEITYPNTYEVSTTFELERVIEEKKLSYPLMIKGKYYKALKVYNLSSAIEAFNKISAEWGFPILVQEVVSGEEINLVGLGDGKGNLAGAVAIKKLSTTELGKVWSAITIDNQKLMNLAKNFVKNTKWRGPFELECMANVNNIYMIEINPRFPAWVYFATDIGINLPKKLVKLMEGKEVEFETSYPLNKMYVRYVEELSCNFSDYLKLLTKKEK